MRLIGFIILCIPAILLAVFVEHGSLDFLGINTSKVFYTEAGGLDYFRLVFSLILAGGGLFLAIQLWNFSKEIDKKTGPNGI